jgi:AcrR family transcriptional regulator
MTMDEIAASLGMSKKTLYHHFASKEDLAREALEEAFRDAERALSQARAGEDRDFGERLRDHVLVVAERHGRLDAAMLEELERSQPALHARYLELSRESIERNFGALLSAGVKAGELRADLDPRLVVRVVQVLAGQLLKPANLGELGLSPRQAVEAILSVVLDGIRVRDPPRKGMGRSR